VRWYCAGFIVDIGEQEPRENEKGTTPFWTSVENMVRNSLFPSWYSWWFDLLTRIGAMPASPLSLAERIAFGLISNGLAYDYDEQAIIDRINRVLEEK